MYVSINHKNEIKMVGISSDPNLTSLYINDDMNPFTDWSEAKICCYKVKVSDGIVIMLTPYVDSRLIEHIDRLGISNETTNSQVTDLEIAVCDVYESTDEQITNIELAICDIYEMIGG